MKKTVFVLLLASQAAFAGNVTGRSVGGSVVLGGLVIPAWNTTYDSCAPEIKHTNVSVTTDVLNGLAQRELKDSDTFKALVKDATALNESERLQAYLGLMGVQSDSEIAELIGSRAIGSKYIHALSKNADLKPADAQLVIERVAQSLLGERR
jgi:hypothetical protein